MPVLLGAAAVIEVRRSMGDTGDGGADSPRARAVLLDRVHRYWVRGVLEQSLYQEARIELGMTVTVDAPPPWDVVVASPDGSSRVVAPGTTMAEVFDELDETMLVLGTPGSGKTTMMLELARELLRRANTDSQHPIPVVLTLSSWALRQEPLGDWIVRKLAARYRIPTAQARLWLNADRLVPLLDGLDEVAEEHQLSIAVLAYRDAAVGTVATGGDSQQLRNRLFATYVRTMLTRRRSDQHSARQTVRRLAFFADLMESSRQTVFTLELLDKFAIPSGRLRSLKLTTRSSLICGLAGRRGNRSSSRAAALRTHRHV
jgi:hypothetical protein